MTLKIKLIAIYFRLIFSVDQRRPCSLAPVGSCLP